MSALATLFVLLESPQWVGMHQVGFRMFWPAVKNLLNYEKKIAENSFK